MKSLKTQFGLRWLFLIAFFLPIVCYAKELPLSSGTYTFQHRYAEHPNIKSILFNVVIDERTVTVSNSVKSSVWPLGVIDQGELFWHSSSQWIIISEESDKVSDNVGACSGGPASIDLLNKEYWTC